MNPVVNPDPLLLESLLNRLDQELIRPVSATFTRLLQACCKHKALWEGKRVHAHILRRGLETDLYLANCLISMYGKCSTVQDAKKVFSNIPQQRNVVSWTAMMNAYSQQGYCKEALQLFRKMNLEGVKPNKMTFATAITACANLETLPEGREIHGYLVEKGFDSDIIVGNALINMYGKCGSVIDAQMTFDSMERWDLFSWTALIVVYAQHGHGNEAFHVFRCMYEHSVKPNAITFISILSACTSVQALEEGKGIHSFILEYGFELQIAVVNAVLTMYGKCGDVENAVGTFSKIHHPHMSSWTAMIAVYAHHGYCDQALQLFSRMQQKDMKPNNITMVTVLNACASPAALADGETIHLCIVKSGYGSDVIIGNALVNMYSKCGSLENAERAFDKMVERDVVSWTVMIVAYTEHGFCKNAFELFQRMQQEGFKPDKITLVSILSACADSAALQVGHNIHYKVLEGGFESDVVVTNALLSMYGKSGSVEDACAIFYSMHQRNAVSWNAMIAVYVHAGNSHKAFRVFQQMQLEVLPDMVSFVNILSTCTSDATLAMGRMTHAIIVDSAFELEFSIENALVNMYSKCGNVMNAQIVFDKMHQRDVVTWTAMIAAYTQLGNNTEALHFFYKMQVAGVKPDKFTLSMVLSACSSPATLTDGKHIHASIIENGFESDVAVENVLINMYGKCGSLVDACKVFEKMFEWDVVSWNALISIYAQHVHGKETFQLFQQMQQEGVQPDKVSFLSVLSACASLADLKVGKMIHTNVMSCGFGSDDAIGNALVNMYSKCGSVDDAWRTFDNLTNRDIVSWTTMVAAYAHHGHAKEALNVFQRMEDERVTPNEISFLSVLSACSHAGLVDQALCYFASMSRDHGIAPNSSHYGCMIDLFSRVGLLDEAEDFMNKMPGQPGVVEWMTLLGACRNYGDMKRGRRAAEHLLELNPLCKAGYVVLSNTYAASGREDAFVTGVEKQP